MQSFLKEKIINKNMEVDNMIYYNKTRNTYKKMHLKIY